MCLYACKTKTLAVWFQWRASQPMTSRAGDRQCGGLAAGVHSACRRHIPESCKNCDKYVSSGEITVPQGAAHIMYYSILSAHKLYHRNEYGHDINTAMSIWTICIGTVRHVGQYSTKI